jgi:hypothetical protein
MKRKFKHDLAWRQKKAERQLAYLKSHPEQLAKKTERIRKRRAEVLGITLAQYEKQLMRAQKARAAAKKAGRA